MTATMALLEECGLLAKLARIPARAATPDELALVHDPAYVAACERVAEAGGGWVDPDTLITPRSYDVAAQRRRRDAERARCGDARRRGVGVLPRAAAGTPRDAGAGDGVLPVQPRRDRRGVRASSSTDSSASRSSTSTCTTATARRTPSTTTGACCTSRRTSTRSIRAPGAADEIGRGDGAGYNHQHPDAARLRRRGASSRRSRRSSCRRCGAFGRSSSSCRRAIDAHFADDIAMQQLSVDGYGALVVDGEAMRRTSCAAGRVRRRAGGRLSPDGAAVVRAPDDRTAARRRTDAGSARHGRYAARRRASTRCSPREVLHGSDVTDSLYTCTLTHDRTHALRAEPDRRARTSATSARRCSTTCWRATTAVSSSCASRTRTGRASYPDVDPGDQREPALARPGLGRRARTSAGRTGRTCSRSGCDLYQAAARPAASRRATRTSAGARRSGWMRCARSSSGEAAAAVRPPLPRRRGQRGGAARGGGEGRGCVVRFKTPLEGSVIAARRDPRRDDVRRRDARRLRDAEVGRLPDVPPGVHRRRRGDEDHARPARRRVDPVGAAARADLPARSASSRR